MKLLNPIGFNDDAALLEIANNKRLSSYDGVLNALAAFQATYGQYLAAAGDPSRAAPPQELTPRLQSSLIAHFKNPPQILRGPISDIRQRLSTDVCSMCGSLGIGTVDHVFPKTVYAELSFHSKNLVPACICNSLRNDGFWDGANARVLHPYFDVVLQTRLVRAKFEPPFESPDIEIEVCCGAIPNRACVEFHVTHVLSKTNVRNFLAGQWSLLRRRHQVVPELEGAVQNDVAFEAAIALALDRTDLEYGTPNNWKSMFLAGLLASRGARRYALRQINDIKRGLIRPDSI